MRFTSSAWLAAITLILLTLSAPVAARGEDLIVEHNPTDSSHFATIQAAIDHAAVIIRNPSSTTTSFRVMVKADPVPYTGPISPISNVPIIGSSTAGTFISGNGSGTLISLNNVASVEIRNFTFRSALIGISVANSSSVSITNNVFQMGTAGTAIQVQGSPSTSIINNTFFNNGTAISTNSDLTITNDIFSTNSAAISTQIALTGLSYNDFFANAANGVADLGAQSIPSPLVPNANPLFVDSANRDFHLQSGSPCVNSGNPRYDNSFDSTTFDMGAYGGPKSDIVLAAVTGLTSSVSPDTPSTITLNWNPAGNSKVAYRVYYGTSSRNYTGAQAEAGASPFNVPVGTTSATLSGLPLTPPAVPGTPQLTSISPLNKGLQISWTTVPGATGYRISYGSEASSLSSSFDVDGTVSSTRIPGLVNGTPYFVAVSALTQTRFFAAVTAVLDSSIGPNFGQASANESSYSQETSQGVGVLQQSDRSNILRDSPEAIAPFPNLPNEGCFIATAAYGCYSAPQVQALRDFRDRFLLTNSPGRAFVAWYYRYGPRGAHFINAHPWLKAPVRVALLPLVAGALVLTGTSPLAKTALVICAALLLAVLFRRKLLLHSGRRALSKFTLTLLLIIVPSLALGAETRSDRPHWSLELKGGAFFPGTANWSKFYDSSYLGEYGGALSYKVFRQVELGLEGSYLSATGKGQQPIHGGDRPVQDSEVTYELFPLNVFVLARGVFREEQWLVPYAAAGWTRMFYRQEVKGGETTRGSVNGYHARAGVQLLLDGLEPESSRNLYLDYGMHHTYLFLEAKYLRARVDTVTTGSVNIGGTSCLGGFLWEF
ncbi:MAG TPA: MXAN_2562 family outer membrane beta-barrel protein [Geomonas sp.]